MTIASGQQALAADILKHATADGYLQLTDSTELTISAGAVTATANFYRVDTESNAASDDLDTITAGTGVADGHPLWIRPENDARTVVVKHGTGNIKCPGGVDILLDDSSDILHLVYDGNLTKWLVVGQFQMALVARQGGSSADWQTTGTTNRALLGAKVQMGSLSVSYTAGQAKASASVTYPESYAAGSPLVFVAVSNQDTNKCIVAANNDVGIPPITSASFTLYPTAGSTFSGSGSVTVVWIAFGPE